ncbi:MAG: (deoxy)nucleoside triphosphate pyrophosphohydrolase [Pseudomonadota bacterium]|nr:8-oxo-dGTP diphosphatase MutT [Alphaproteobacteria bacterium]
MNKLVLVAACALVDASGRVLLAQRPKGKPMAGLWEFPGGKVEPGESPEACLIRELGEELDMEVLPSSLKPLSFSSHAYGAEEGNFDILLLLYICRLWRSGPTPREAQTLAWVRPADLRKYPMPAADLPLIDPLCDAVTVI